MRGKTPNAIKFLSILLVMSFLVFALAGCGSSGGSGSGAPPGGASSGSGQASKGITIGVMGPTSGSEAYYGNDMLQSYQLAVDEINAAGGILGRQVALYSADDG